MDSDSIDRMLLSMYAACAAEESIEVVRPLSRPYWRLTATSRALGRVVGKSRPIDTEEECELEMIRSIWLLGEELYFSMDKVQ